MEAEEMRKVAIVLVVLLAMPSFAGEPENVPAAKESAQKKDDRNHNPIARFFVHTVGAPMASGLKAGAKKISSGF